MSDMSQPEKLTTGPPIRRRRRGGSQRLTRLLHSWLSMSIMLVVLFFALTGLLLHHPDWTFGTVPLTTQVSGELPRGSIVNRTPNFLDISEYLRSGQGASGRVSDYGVSGNAGHLSYASPGSSTNATFDLDTGSFTLTTTHYGWVSYFSDLHRGLNTSDAWGWVIDIAAVVLALVALTGVVLQLLIRKKRTTALVLLAVGVVVGVGMMFLA